MPNILIKLKSFSEKVKQKPQIEIITSILTQTLQIYKQTLFSGNGF